MYFVQILALIGHFSCQGTIPWVWLGAVSYRGPALGCDWLLSLTGDQFLALIGYCLLQGTSSWLWLATVSYSGPVLGCDWLLFLTVDQFLAVIGYCFLQGTSSWLCVGRKHMVVSPWKFCGNPANLRLFIWGKNLYFEKLYKNKKPYQDWKMPSWTWLFPLDLSSITI